jgi:hypothetical protein
MRPKKYKREFVIKINTNYSLNFTKLFLIAWIISIHINEAYVIKNQ